MAEVVGAAFLGLIKYVKDKRGGDFLDSVIEEAGEETRKVFSRKIITISWHPYPAYVKFLRAIDKKMGRGDLVLCRELGQVAAKRDLETVYSMYKEKAGPERLIQDGSIIWKSYYRNAGTFVVVSWDMNNTIMRIKNFPEMDPAHCRLMEGWVNEVLCLLGVKMIREIKETKCMSQGDPYHEFTCVWAR